MVAYEFVTSTLSYAGHRSMKACEASPGGAPARTQHGPGMKKGIIYHADRIRVYRSYYRSNRSLSRHLLSAAET